VGLGIEDSLRLLRCGGIIEVDKGFAPDVLLEDGELGSDRSGIVVGRGCRHRCADNKTWEGPGVQLGMEWTDGRELRFTLA